MQIKLDLKKSLEKNAADYFERAKKARRKKEGAIKIIKSVKEKIQEEAAEKEKQERVVVKKEWYEKFRWFFTSNNFLVIGGRDETTNDILIKKYLEENDVVFHTELAGSPFVIIKDGKKAELLDLNEAAQFCACFSKAWKSGLATTEVYHVNSEQVSKEPIKKGAFMIYGKRSYYAPIMELAIGNYNGKAFIGPKGAVEKHCNDFSIIVQGNEKKSDIAKKIAKQFNLDIDDVIRVLPEGCKIKKVKK